MVKLQKLGQTDLTINPIGLGAIAIGSKNMYPQVEEEMSREIFMAALNNGMNFIDTAFYYGFGRSEELIGEILKETGKRDEVILATKVSH